MLKENYSKVLENVNAAAKRAGRNPSDVTLIAVGKMHEPGELQEVYEAGCRDFGENKVQELAGKIVVLPKDIRWHLIGIFFSHAIVGNINKFRLQFLQPANQLQTGHLPNPRRIVSAIQFQLLHKTLEAKIKSVHILFNSR